MLPQPWLPLRKGQTLVNGARQGSSDGKKDEAVVLTLRKRYSSVRRGSRRTALETRTSAGDLFGKQTGGRSGNGSAPDDNTPSNPWDESQAGPSNSSRHPLANVNHRLSFDDASGVIMLPEDGDWLVEHGDSDSEDYGSTSGSGVSPAETPQAADSPSEGVTSVMPVPAATPSKARYGTYYHHPEKRRQTIPGAFPRS